MSASSLSWVLIPTMGQVQSGDGVRVISFAGKSRHKNTQELMSNCLLILMPSPNLADIVVWTFKRPFWPAFNLFSALYIISSLGNCIHVLAFQSLWAIQPNKRLKGCCSSCWSVFCCFLCRKRYRRRGYKYRFSIQWLDSMNFIGMKFKLLIQSSIKGSHDRNVFLCVSFLSKLHYHPCEHLHHIEESKLGQDFLDREDLPPTQKMK